MMTFLDVYHTWKVLPMSPYTCYLCPQSIHLYKGEHSFLPFERCFGCQKCYVDRESSHKKRTNILLGSAPPGGFRASFPRVNW